VDFILYKANAPIAKNTAIISILLIMVKKNETTMTVKSIFHQVVFSIPPRKLSINQDEKIALLTITHIINRAMYKRAKIHASGIPKKVIISVRIANGGTT
jgi:hypothetical protein